MIAVLWWASTAEAGDGPWTLASAEHDLYVGMDLYGYQRFRVAGAEPSDLDAQVRALGIPIIWSWGAMDAVETELRIQLEGVAVADPSAAPCDDAERDDWCATTVGVGDLSAALKLRLLDEFRYHPLTLTFIPTLRTGAPHRATRGRLTNLGEGQTDLGLGLRVGRTGGLGSQWYALSGAATYWLRASASATTDRRLPGDEISWDTSAVVCVAHRLGLGPVAQGFHRLWGLDLDEAPLDQAHGFASLKAQQIKIGGRASLYLPRGLTLSATAMTTAYARNNPTDTWVLGLGVGVHREPRR
ncbi:MAG: hypothetical protein KTR31_13395 [Myxococcales bacterium]|nr:hypothetical protein [Myxococcales bacterium]